MLHKYIIYTKRTPISRPSYRNSSNNNLSDANREAELTTRCPFTCPFTHRLRFIVLIFFDAVYARAYATVLLYVFRNTYKTINAVCATMYTHAFKSDTFCVIRLCAQTLVFEATAKTRLNVHLSGTSAF